MCFLHFCRQGTEADKAADYANYFCSYSYLYHQKQMLMDHVRMQAYHSAIMKNQHLFAGKTVLDVGTGSGVLSIWAAKAGAAKVYAVEYTDMAKHARHLVEKNGLSHIVEVIQSSVGECLSERMLSSRLSLSDLIGMDGMGSEQRNWSCLGRWTSS